jgi:serine/threonine-protein kinase
MSARRTRRADEVAFLAEYVDAYLGEAMAMSIADLRARQPPPYASLGLGAAGLAYAFVHAHAVRREPRFLAEARRWIDAAWEERAAPDAFRAAPPDDRSGTRLAAIDEVGSIAYGRAGLVFLAAAVEARGAGAGWSERIDELVALTRIQPATTADYMEGAAGRLAAVTALYRLRADPALRALGDALARWLIEAPPLAYGPWYAYGRAGVADAVLRWSLATGFDLPGRWLDTVDALAATPHDRGHPLHHSWCNGSAGIAAVLVSAFERTGRRAWRDLATRAAEHAASDARGTPGVCCGLGGRAYALVAVHRVAASRRRLDRARVLAIEAIQSPPQDYPNSLLRGHPGLVCLALDLAQQF